MPTLSHFVLPDNTDAWTPEARECPSCFALPDSIVLEMNGFHDAVDAIRHNEEHADDCARCERAAEVEAIRTELRARKRHNRRDRRAMKAYRRTGDKAYFNKAVEYYGRQTHRFCNRVRNVA